MKILKVGTILGILASALIAAAWVLGLVQEEEAVQSLKKILGVLVIFSVASGAVAWIVGKSRGTEPVDRAN